MPNWLDLDTERPELDPSNKQDREFLERRRAVAKARGEVEPVVDETPETNILRWGAYSSLKAGIDATRDKTDPLYRYEKHPRDGE